MKNSELRTFQKTYRVRLVSGEIETVVAQDCYFATGGSLGFYVYDDDLRALGSGRIVRAYSPNAYVSFEEGFTENLASGDTKEANGSEKDGSC